MTNRFPVAAALLAMALARLMAAPLTDPEADRFNPVLGTQTFAPRYQLTTETKLVETALAIRAMGSDTIKFYLGRDFPRQYGLTLPPGIASLTALVRDEPSCRRVLDLPFRHFVVWAYAFSVPGDVYWKDGVSASERQREYDELFGLTRYLLTHYSGSGKHFYLGHWEGDWYLLPNYNTATNPAPATLQGMIDWLNLRQQAVDDAKRSTPHADVQVYAYAEVNRVRDAMVNGPSSNQRVVNRVLPHVPQLDFVSWSAYDGQHLGASDLRATLDFIESQLPPAKAAVLPGRRVFVGEYGWGGSLSSAAQEAPTRSFVRHLLPWGCPFVLFWEMYDNEGKAFWLIDQTGARTPCYDFHQRFYNLARLHVAEFRQTHGRVPDAREFGTALAAKLARPLPAPLPLTLAHGAVCALGPASARVRATLEQGVYGDDQAAVAVFWGREDGGTDPAAWNQRTHAGVNTRFGAVPFDVVLTNLVAGARYHFRFRATNATASAWAPATASFVHTPDATACASPTLSTDRTVASLVLSWPLEAGPWVLGTATSLEPPIAWQPSLEALSLTNGYWRAEAPLATYRARFFRLQAP